MKARLTIVSLVALLGSCIFGGAQDPDCATYCRVMEDNCPMTFHDDGGEFDEQACLDACATYAHLPADEQPESLGDPVRNSDTLECRTYHANNAATDPNGVHCGHASPNPPNTCVDFTPLCAEFCGGVDAMKAGYTGFSEVCAGTDVAIPDIKDCGAFCSTLAEGRRGDESGNTAHCRLTWAERAVGDRDLCINAGEASPTCINP